MEASLSPPGRLWVRKGLAEKVLVPLNSTPFECMAEEQATNLLRALAEDVLRKRKEGPWSVLGIDRDRCDAERTSAAFRKVRTGGRRRTDAGKESVGQHPCWTTCCVLERLANRVLTTNHCVHLFAFQPCIDPDGNAAPSRSVYAIARHGGGIPGRRGIQSSVLCFPRDSSPLPPEKGGNRGADGGQGGRAWSKTF